MALRGLELLKEKISKEEQKRYGISYLLWSFRIKVALANLLAGRKKEARAHFLEAFGGSPQGKLLAVLAWTPFELLPARLISRLLRQIRLARRALVFRSA